MIEWLFPSQTTSTLIIKTPHTLTFSVQPSHSRNCIIKLKTQTFLLVRNGEAGINKYVYLSTCIPSLMQSGKKEAFFLFIKFFLFPLHPSANFLGIHALSAMLGLGGMSCMTRLLHSPLQTKKNLNRRDFYPEN